MARTRELLPKIVSEAFEIPHHEQWHVRFWVAISRKLRLGVARRRALRVDESLGLVRAQRESLPLLQLAPLPSVRRIALVRSNNVTKLEDLSASPPIV